MNPGAEKFLLTRCNAVCASGRLTHFYKNASALAGANTRCYAFAAICLVGLSLHCTLSCRCIKPIPFSSHPCVWLARGTSIWGRHWWKHAYAIAEPGARPIHLTSEYVCACVCACVSVCARAPCLCVCVCVCVRACVLVSVWLSVWLPACVSARVCMCVLCVCGASARAARIHTGFV